ncbi:6-phosphogluconate dehydrogenase C-terminal domain-like protein [Auricularia subglabra TFB-10046 SS5]|nr:6-phosphogluconate dehydrogenase C-terminal domain-like protein [Auricularia subglabra TFB-10046 SS5]
MDESVDVLLVGFGAVGTMYAYIMQHGGRARVSVVCRRNFQSVKAHGIDISSEKYGTIKGWRPYRVFNSVSAACATNKPYNYVVLATKALPDVGPSNSEILEPLLSPSTYPFPQPVYVLMQNGIGVEKDLFESVSLATSGHPKVILASLYIMVNVVDGQVIHCDTERIAIGICRDTSRTENSAEETAILEPFASLITAAGSTVQIVSDIQGIKFSKNVWNAVFSTCSTLARCGLPGFFQHPHISEAVVPVIRAMFVEVVAVGRALGYDESVIPTSAIDACIAETATINTRSGIRHKPSMLVDLEMSQPLELEVILGELLRRAKSLNVDVPRIETLFALLTVVQAQILSANVSEHHSLPPSPGATPWRRILRRLRARR